MVADYLSHEQVVLKNTTEESFDDALRVFVHHTQEPVHPTQQSSTDVTYDDLRRTLSEHRERYAQHKAVQEQLRGATKRYETFFLVFNALDASILTGGVRVLQLL
jgi:hypothetical protein